MGVDVNKIPPNEEFAQMLAQQLNLPVQQKKSYCLVWLIGYVPVGHSNTNPTKFGEEAYMHLHLWNNTVRQKGSGLAFVKMGLPLFFEKLQLKTLYCQPYALNAAPNKTLPKAGFELLKEYITIPGYLNFEQPVKLWQLTRERFDELRSND